MASDEARDKVKTMMKKCSIFQLENTKTTDGSFDNSISDLNYKNIKIPSPGRIITVSLNKAGSPKEIKNILLNTSNKLFNNPECDFVPSHCKNFCDKNHEKYIQLLNKDNIDIKTLKQLSWNGVPDCCRLKAWNLLSGILSSSSSSHYENTIQKQKEYQALIKSYYECRNTSSSEGILRQICIDIPRTYPLLPLFQNSIVQKMYERILYIWSIRHPASGYVQGMNDLISPFLYSALYPHFGSQVFTCDPSILSKDTLDQAEAYCFFLLTKLLDQIINNYTPDQPGIQTKIHKIKCLVERFDVSLYMKLLSLSFDETLFCYKWLNNLFVRDFSLKCVIRLWDTMWAQNDGFDVFIVYICGAILKLFSEHIKNITESFQLILFFQDLPTTNWNENNISVLLAEAYLLFSLYSTYIN